jgi:peptidoglycan/LPS O-acetylase OafA/YrhL
VILTTAELARSWRRLDGVDLLRGLAIFFVLMNHVNMRLLGAYVPYTRGLPAQLVSSLVWNGQYGVQIFFVVSGFLISSTTLRRWGSIGQVNVCDFYRLRFARIAPLLLLLLVVLSVLDLIHVEGFVVSQKTGGLGRALLAAFTFHINLLEARRGYLPPGWDVLWSLSVEEMFYLLFPLVCRGFRRVSFLLVLLSVFVALGPFARSHAFNPNSVWREYSYLGGMDAIALGCLTALFCAKVDVSRALLRVCGVVGAVMLVFILGFSNLSYRWGLGRNGLNMTVLALGACLVVIAVAQTRWRAPRAVWRLVRMGRLSYEIYLTHIFVVIALFDLFLAAGRPMRAVPALFVGVVALSGVFGAVVSRVYSEPMNRWLRERWGEGSKKLGSVVDGDGRVVGAESILSR